LRRHLLFLEIMNYIKVTFEIHSAEQGEVLIALLSEAGYDGFEESENALLAYIEQPKFHEDELGAIAQSMHIAFKTEIIPSQNWNAIWESNFPPVIVDDFCTIRADFHDIKVTTPYEIVITPKMSFGTGHHATTQLVMLLLKETDLRGKSVLDFGTGTGVLAILAEMLGATSTLAIDNDDWCVENAQENVARNNCKHITVQKGSLNDAEMARADVILANINRHILLEYMPALFEKLNVGGTIIMSGLLTTDKDIIIAAAETAGFKFGKIMERANWIAIKLSKV
jgi:ribosomal protein L11 methyltransferase